MYPSWPLAQSSVTHWLVGCKPPSILKFFNLLLLSQASYRWHLQ